MAGSRRIIGAIGIALLVLFVAAVTAAVRPDDDSPFRRKFDEWYRLNPPAEAPPAASDRRLLERHRPIYHLGEKAELPIDFYEDYVAGSDLFDGSGRLVAAAPTRDILNRWRSDPAMPLVHKGRPVGRTAAPVVYGKVERDVAAFASGARRMVFLTYTLAFRTSGLIKGLAAWKEAALGIVAASDDWHQLDHYINVTLAMDETHGDPMPIAVIFQHHNYMRTWRVIGPSGPGRLTLPADGRVRVDIALRSNEAYPHLGGARRWRAVSFLTEQTARYLIDGTDPPLMSGRDHTEPARILGELRLITLPPADAFYTFRGSLGQSRWLPGRSGPPGADFNTLPAFKKPVAQMLVFYWHEQASEYSNRLGAIRAKAWRGEQFDIGPMLAAFEREAGLSR